MNVTLGQYHFCFLNMAPQRIGGKGLLQSLIKTETLIM